MKSNTRMFLHGFLGSRYSCPFKENCIAVELAGHGKTPIDFNTSFDGFIDSLVERIHKPIHLIGYSMGGRIAMRMAILYPDLFKSITLVSAHPGGGQSSSQEAIIKDMCAMQFSSFIRRWYSQPMFIGTDIEKRVMQTRIHNPEKLIMSFEMF